MVLASPTAVPNVNVNEIPEQGKRYITIRSARIFHDRTLGANTLHKFSAEDEKHALTILKQVRNLIVFEAL